MRYCVLILSALLVVSSCTKVEETPSRLDTLRESKWRLDAGTVHTIQHANASAPAVNKTEAFVINECAKDDLFVFREGHDGAHIPGELTCSINETAEIQFRWGLQENDTKMFIYDAKEFFGTDVNAEILEFYNDKFGIKFNKYTDVQAPLVTDGPAVWYTDTTTYTMYFKKI